MINSWGSNDPFRKIQADLQIVLFFRLKIEHDPFLPGSRPEVMYDDMPAKITINQWRNKYPEFAAQYAQAKISQIETLVDEIIDIADDAAQDEIINDQGARVCNSEFIARSRLRIDTRKWLAAKLIPRLYGDKMMHL